MMYTAVIKLKKFLTKDIKSLFSVSDFFIAAQHTLIYIYYKYLYDNLKIPSGSKSAHVDQVQKYLDVIKNIENPSKSFSRIFTIVGGDCMQKKLIPIQEKHLKRSRPPKSKISH